MVNLKNKYLLNNVNEKFLAYKFLMVCHLFYLTTVEINELRSFSKKQGIGCVNVKNKIVKQFLKTKELSLIDTTFVGQNLLFFSNSFNSLVNFYNLVKNERTKLVPLVFFGEKSLIILTNNVKLELFEISVIRNSFLKFLFFYNLIFLYKLFQLNISFNYFLKKYANINAIN